MCDFAANVIPGKKQVECVSPKDREHTIALIFALTERCFVQASPETQAACVAPQETAVTAGAAGAEQADALGLGASSKEVLKAFSAVEWVEQETLQELLDHLRDALGATGIYLAKYEEQVAREDGQVMPALRYVAADATHEHMLEQCLFEVFTQHPGRFQ